MNTFRIRRALIVVAVLASSHQAVYALTPDDAGTYEWLKPDGRPSGVLYQLSRSNDGSGKWVARGRLPNHEWKDVSCDSGCQYHDSSADDLKRFFPESWLTNANISCILNDAQAFCAYSGKTDSSRNGHIIFTLVTPKPIPVMVRRVANPQD